MNRSIEIEQLHERASALTGLKDFGGNEDGYLEALRALMDSVDSDVRFNEFGTQMYQQLLIGNLVGRLMAQKGFDDHPQCLEQRIRKPIIVTGFTRSGTTALNKLLSRVPNTQGLEYWIGSFPMQRPARETWDQIPAYQQVAAGLEQLNAQAPKLRSIHSMRVDEPDEDRLILSHSFKSYGLQGFIWSPSYGDWLMKNDCGKAYERMRKVLQLIGYRDPATWVLKDPMHLPWIDLLLEQFPDACIVHTCREPADVMPSVCSLMHTVAGLFQPIDKPSFGRRVFEDYARQMDRFMALRRKLDPARFLDVQYNDLVADPVAVAKRIYRHFDVDIGEEGDAALQLWASQNKQNKYGRHEYTLEEFGLSKQLVDERLTAYRQTYLQR